LADALPMTLRIYRSLSSAMVPLSIAVINRRLKLGKEDPARVGERRGLSADIRPNGPLVWIHGASVGEVLAAAALIEKLRALTRAEGRDPNAVGIEAWTSCGSGTPADWRKEAAFWKSAGASHICLTTTFNRRHHSRIAGRAAADHLAAMRAYRDAVFDAL